MIGERFSRLLVIGLVPDRKNPKALCRCDCGNICAPQRGALRNGRAKSCGCLRVERFTAMASTPILTPDGARSRRAACCAQWHAANPDKNRAASRKHYRLHKGKVKSYCHARRARLASAGGTTSAGIERKLFVMQRGKCAVCRVKLSFVTPHLDHITPLAKGGRNEDCNLQLLCSTCNLSNGAKDPLEFMRSRGFLL